MADALELLAGPITLYLAPLGTAFPLVSAAPGAAWVKVGTNGASNYDEDGVNVGGDESIEDWRGLGSTGPLKSWRTEETLTIGLTLRDATPAQVKLAFNNNTVTATAAALGVPGTEKMGLRKGPKVARRAALLRAQQSPLMEVGAMQFEVPIVRFGSASEMTFEKGTPVGTELEFVALEDTAAALEEERFGRLVVQSAVPG